MPIQRNVQRMVAFSMLDLFNGAVIGTPTCSVSKDGGAFVAATNSPQPVTGGNGGEWTLTLTASEMDAAVVMVEAVLTGAVTYRDPIYPEADYTATKAAYLDSSVSAVPAAVRSNLATELGRVDAAVSSRLPTSSYVAPDNASIGTTASTVSAKLDATISSRLAKADYTAPDNNEIGASASDIQAIKAKTDLLGSGNVTFVTNVIIPDAAIIYRGTDYLAEDGFNLVFTLSGPDISTATVALLTQDATRSTFANATVLSAHSISLAFTSTQTTAMKAGTCTYLVQATLANAHKVILGTLTITVI